MDPFLAIMLIVAAAFLVDPATKLVSKLLDLRYRRREAKKLLEQVPAEEPAEEQLLLGTMPDWVDPKDPDEVEAWKKARGEVVHNRPTPKSNHRE